MRQITLILPYYRAPLMLKKQLEVVNDYPPYFWTVIVDDCSPEPADGVVDKEDMVSLYRIDDDIPWNREGARNLGAHVAKTDWIIQADIDHVLPVDCADKLFDYILAMEFLGENRWYRFPRFRVGKADETRRKDDLPRDQEYGPIKPHIDSYLCTKEMYWRAGGYNEDYSGCLGGGGQFLKMMKLVAGEPVLLPDDIYLEVHTRHSVPDASVSDLSRDKAEFKRRRDRIGLKKAENPLRFKWHKIQ
jgi:hypothetical protein